MRVRDLKRYLDEQENISQTKVESENWLKMNDFLSFIVNSQEGMAPVYISKKNIFLYALIVPEDKISGDYIDDLLNWSFRISHGYGYGYSYANQEKTPFLSEPMDSARPDLLEGSIPIFFLRDCFNHTLTKLEINQKISHVLEICWSKDRGAFSKFNDIGDYEDISTMENTKDLKLCTLRKEELDFYLYLSNSVLIRFFDVMRHPSDFSKAMHDKREENIYKNPNEMIFYSLLTEKRDDGEINLSWLRGFQIIRNRKSSDIMMAKITNDEEREYASFIILDFKNGLNKEWSSNPAELGNYFEDSDLPFETSPAFFRPEVMSKYSSDPEKYTLNSSSIDCRGAWSIYYNVNDEGQVHAYIKDLSNLPYSEQLYWKSYNEEPKSGISENALKNDFLGEWSTEYDPLGSLKNKISNFPTFTINGESRLLWKMPKLPPTRNIDRLNYVRTESKKEWEDQVSTLYQILVEGLQSKSINALAKKLDCRDGQLKSSKQLIKCLEAIEIKEEDYKKVSEPLTELWILRSEIIAHPGNLNYPNGDLRLHYRNLLERCDIAFKLLQEIIEKELLNS